MDLFNIGQKITLFFQKDINMVEMTCTINKVFEDRLVLELPQYFMRYINFLQVGCKSTAKVFSKFGTVDFNTLVISSPLEEEFIIEFDCNSVRFTSGSELPGINAIEKLDIKYQKEQLECKTFDLKAEQIKFYCEKKLIIGENIEGTLFLPKNYGIIDFKGMIKEVDEVYDNEYTIQISIMTEEARQNLLYYIYMYSKDSD